jgi:hypothetical protein
VTRRSLYAVLSVLGAVVPLTALVPWVMQHGLDIPLMIRELFANRISAFFALDVIVSAVVVIVFAYIERVRGWWIAVLGVLLVGVSLGLPLLLFLREERGGRGDRLANH